MFEFELNGEKYSLKYKIKALIYFEQISGHNYSVQGMLESISLFYSFILANYPTFSMSPDEFIDALDDNQMVLIEFNRWLIEEQKKQELMANDPKKSKGKKKV